MIFSVEDIAHMIWNEKFVYHRETTRWMLGAMEEFIFPFEDKFWRILVEHNFSNRDYVIRGPMEAFEVHLVKRVIDVWELV